MDKPGYHLREIKRGVLGTSSKIREELEELEDAELQGVKLMVLQELSDIIGTVRAYLETNYPSIHLDDLIAMNAVTKRAFDNGHRTAPPLAAPPAPAHSWVDKGDGGAPYCLGCSDPHNHYMGDKKGPCPGRKSVVIGCGCGCTATVTCPRHGGRWA